MNKFTKVFCFIFMLLFSSDFLFAETKTKEYKEDKVLLEDFIKKASKGLTVKGLKGLILISKENLDARNLLRKNGVGYVTDSVPADFGVKTLIVENVSKKTTLWEVNFLLERLAENPKYLSFKKSEKNARGAVQFTKEMYELMRDRYPKAKIEKSFKNGTTSNTNSFRALHLLAHEDMLCLKSKNVKAIGAAYNGGCSQGKLLLSKKPSKMYKETQGYVKKHQQVALLMK